MSVHEDRREAKSQRIPFEAIVELGGDAGMGSAFEAQGVDLSANGMHLRTAYLPDLGQPLLCRFGSGAQEISADADVVWRREGARGGEFGIRFSNLDGASAAALWEMCGVARAEGSGAALRESARPEADPGTRVRLHIDGLGSPMKARVRGSSEGELLVGSNLEFLRVGRTLELEDVDRGGKRPAHIDRVDVEVDSESRVPQLVVTLRYDDVAQDESPPEKVYAAAVSSTSTSPRSSTPSVEASAPAPSVAVATSRASDVDDDSVEEEQVARLMRSRFSSAAADIMPKVTAFGIRARTTVGLLLSKAVERSRGESAAPRRMTSPPPTGALHASGKRVVRDGDDDRRDAAPEKRAKIGKKGIVAIGGAAGLLTVIGAMAMHKTAPPPGAVVTEPTNAATTTTTAAPAADLPVIGALQAEVPLFGPTTLSTTEPALAASPSAPTAFGGAAEPAMGAANPPSIQEVDDQRSDSDDHRSGSKPHAKVTPFGHGKVGHAVVLRMKTDGEITEIHGVRTATGFTVTVPGRRALDAGSSLASRDSRIASVKVSRGSKGSELSFQFKDGVPPYLVRAKGTDLQIALGKPSDGDDKDKSDKPSKTDKDKSDQDEHKHGVTAKKPDHESHHRSKKD
ncbi:MAG TPA: PilZ domain-containing protein [Polyangiaceae bacterium]|nr:PilZ domain-containing protein [Polyangiaceae bacterium]